MSEGGQQLPLVAKAPHEFFAGQMSGHHFERDGLLELPIGAPCQIDLAHAARTQQPFGQIGTDALPGPRQRHAGVRGSGVLRGGRGLRAQLAMPAVRGEKGPDLFPNQRIRSGLRSEPRFPLGFRLFERGMKQFLDALPE